MVDLSPRIIPKVYKIILVGEKGVGKRKIIDRVRIPAFHNPSTSPPQPTPQTIPPSHRSPKANIPQVRPKHLHRRLRRRNLDRLPKTNRPRRPRRLPRHLRYHHPHRRRDGSLPARALGATDPRCGCCALGVLDYVAGELCGG